MEIKISITLDGKLNLNFALNLILLIVNALSLAS